MSSVAATLPLFSPGLFSQSGGRHQPARTPQPVRRRGSREQGLALEVLGHAVEYLADMQLYSGDASPDAGEAIHLLMGCSRAVFLECAELVPLRQRVQKALLSRLHLEALLPKRRSS